jgi:membrane-bound metal-dependent hydrolase YbcI (DUF457 family)
MKPSEHVAFSFLLAQFWVQPHCGATGTVLMIVAGNLPDLDGVTFLAGRSIYRQYHRVVGHGLPVTLAGPALLAWLGTAALGLQPFWLLWAWLQASLLAHLFADVVFYRWPVQLLWPLTCWGWGGGLIHWNDLLPTLILYAGAMGCLIPPRGELTSATAGLAAFSLYLGWRAWRPRSRWGWSAWLTGDWAVHHARFWRWLTGDFVT